MPLHRLFSEIIILNYMYPRLLYVHIHFPFVTLNVKQKTDKITTRNINEIRNNNVFLVLLFPNLVFRSRGKSMFSHFSKLMNKPFYDSTFCSLRPWDSSMMSVSTDLQLYLS